MTENEELFGDLKMTMKKVSEFKAEVSRLHGHWHERGGPFGVVAGHLHDAIDDLAKAMAVLMEQTRGL